LKQFPKILSLALFFAAGAAVVSLFADTASVSANGSSGTTQTPPTGSPPDGTPPGPPPDGTAGGPGMAAAVPNTLAATETVSGSSATIDGKTLTAAAADTSVIYAADGASLTLKNVTLKKTGGDTSSDDASNFYGQNAGLVAAGSSAVTATNLTVETSAEGANAVFSTGADSKIVIDGVTVKTTNNSSRGLDATWGGTIVARNVKIETLGAHCAALATDRGEGTVTVSAATGTTAGEGSPGIYSTGAISASNSTFSATGSEAAVIEGKNSIVLTDTDISGAVRAGVMIYQSFSGDAGIGTGTFTMTRGTLTAKAGPLFYSTNTDAVINLSAVTLKGTSGALFAAAADQWGTTGSNGGRVTLNAKKQALDGTVAVDSVSSLTLNLADSSSWTGAVVASTGAPDSGKPAGGNPGPPAAWAPAERRRAAEWAPAARPRAAAWALAARPRPVAWAPASRPRPVPPPPLPRIPSPLGP